MSYDDAAAELMKEWIINTCIKWTNGDLLRGGLCVF
jgi:hypothetical protein